VSSQRCDDVTVLRVYLPCSGTQTFKGHHPLSFARDCARVLASTGEAPPNPTVIDQLRGEGRSYNCVLGDLGRGGNHHRPGGGRR
jgi:hypothetical protein